MKNRKPIQYFALSVVFLAVAVVFYSGSGISLANFLIFFFSGAAFGSFIRAGIIASKNSD